MLKLLNKFMSVACYACFAYHLRQLLYGQFGLAIRQAVGYILEDSASEKHRFLAVSA